MSAILVKHKKRGRLAQLVELLPYKQAVTGSSPVPSIFARLFAPFQGLTFTGSHHFRVLQSQTLRYIG
jgi:hypothetical protein